MKLQDQIPEIGEVFTLIRGGLGAIGAPVGKAMRVNQPPVRVNGSLNTCIFAQTTNGDIWSLPGDSEIEYDQGEFNFQRPGKKAEDLIPQTISIDQQIEYIHRIKNDGHHGSTAILNAVEENLISIKRWNQNPLWSQLDIEKVMTDLLTGIHSQSNYEGIPPTFSESAVQNAEAALGMLQAFKKRDGARKLNPGHGFTEGSEL